MARKTISLNECYQVLQIAQNSSMKEVKHAYRKWAFELHPDLNPNNSSANTAFQKLNEAYVTIIAYLDAQDKKMSAKGSFFDAKSDAHKAEKEAAKQKAREEELKAKEARAKKEQERKERYEREKQADERRRAKERTERERIERDRLREHIEKENVKLKAKKETEKVHVLREEAKREAADKNRLMTQMEDEAKKREVAKEKEKERSTRSYSNHGKPIPDQKKYHGSSNGPDTYETSNQSQNEQSSHSKFSHDDDMREQILQELLEDDYARKVYEDIYNELHARKNEQNFTEHQDESTATSDTIKNKKTQSKTIEAESVKSKNKNTASHQTLTGQVATGIKQGISGWFKGQIDDELELFFPASKLIAGARMRLQIRIGWSGELQVVELTLPADFLPGKPFRLRGMGKKIGKWQGDLYLKLQVK